MTDKVIYNAIIDKKLVRNIGLEDNSLDNIVRIIKNAAKNLYNKNVSTGRITNILVQKYSGLWKIVIFKDQE